MTVLSDTQIRTRIAAGELVPSGNPGHAEECSFAFRPGRAFLPGSKEAPIDFPGPENSARVVVDPGNMIWIRTRDRVMIPHDIVGFWWQTNSLSREGLMLVNMSMVEPGYEGDLACLFVNFGRGKVLIEPDTVIAKMVFMEVCGEVAKPFSSKTTRQAYDTRLNKLALEQPASFLQISEMAGGLKEQRAAALAEISEAATGLRKEADEDLRKARQAAVDEFKSDIPGVLRKSFAWALGLFAILVLANLALSWGKGQFFPNVKEIARSEAEDVLSQRTVMTTTPNSVETAKLLRQIDALNKRIETLEKAKR